MALLYEYPKRNISAQEKIAFASEKINERKKVNKMMLKSAVLLVVLLFLAVIVDIVWLKVVLIVLGLFTFLTSLLFANSIRLSLDDDIFVKIYDDRIESYQPPAFGVRKRRITINYDDVIESNQTTMGSISFKLKGNKSESIYFTDGATKRFFIENCYEKINYPKRDYIDYPDIEDEKDDPDYKWNNWKSF